jgi:ribosomal protein S18 acetylase RimI-like enzyme
MRPSDKPAVMAILRSTPEFLPHEVPIAEELIDAYLTTPKESGYRILVAELDGELSGYACYGETPLTKGTWDVYWIAVHRGKQGGGIGKALMAATERDIKTTGGRLVVIETSGKPEYNRTRRFYVMLGYAEVARIADYYDVGDDLVVLVKRLG